MFQFHVVPNIKDINFWEQFTTQQHLLPLKQGCSEYQRYQLLRAIHNTSSVYKIAPPVVPNIKDINFWEQFTTGFGFFSYVVLLFRISKISTFESNSQQKGLTTPMEEGCSEYQRYQLLRAIHNSFCLLFFLFPVVPNIKDINFWEQFTTSAWRVLRRTSLFRISKISTFESNSQHIISRYLSRIGCSEYQRYQLLRAIHN